MKGDCIMKAYGITGLLFLAMILLVGFTQTAVAAEQTPAAGTASTTSPAPAATTETNGTDAKATEDKAVETKSKHAASKHAKTKHTASKHAKTKHAASKHVESTTEKEANPSDASTPSEGTPNVSVGGEIKVRASNRK